MTLAGIIQWAIYAVLVVAPLVWNLVKYVKLALIQKNWKPILSLLLELMSNAEYMFDSGAARKEWVMSTVEVTAKAMGIQVDMAEVARMIDELCAASKNINAGNTRKAK